MKLLKGGASYKKFLNTCHKQKKVNAHCAQFNTLLAALELANDTFYLIGSAVF
jgi:hypothetical protein